MSAAQHTPGPWTAFKQNGKHVEADAWSTECEGARVSMHAPIKAGKQVVALVVASSRHWPDLRDIAPDCRLIAAAPEMAVLLREVLPLVDSHGNLSQSDAIRAVLAKVDGSAA